MANCRFLERPIANCCDANTSKPPQQIAKGFDVTFQRLSFLWFIPSKARVFDELHNFFSLAGNQAVAQTQMGQTWRCCSMSSFTVKQAQGNRAIFRDQSTNSCCHYCGLELLTVFKVCNGTIRAGNANHKVHAVCGKVNFATTVRYILNGSRGKQLQNPLRYGIISGVSQQRVVEEATLKVCLYDTERVIRRGIDAKNARKWCHKRYTEFSAQKGNPGGTSVYMRW